MSYSEENGQVVRIMKITKRKLVGLIHWWISLEPVRHQHWCVIDRAVESADRCEHQFSSWVCEGLLCLGQERKNCPGCERGKPCKLGSGKNFMRCECGMGGHV
jgi:hypothetical protein